MSLSMSQKPRQPRNYYLPSVMKFTLILLCMMSSLSLIAENSRHDWVSTRLSLQRQSQDPHEWTSYYHDTTNSVVLSKRALFTSKSSIRHEIAHAWHYNVIMASPILKREWVESEEDWTFYECQNDLDCRIRDKFDEYRESGELSELYVEVWPNTTRNYRYLKECQDGGVDPGRDIQHIAECNVREFFAEISTIFMDAGTRPPFDRDGLKELDQDLYDLMVDAWKYNPDVVAHETSQLNLFATIPLSKWITMLNANESSSFGDINHERWMTVNINVNRGGDYFGAVANGVQLSKERFFRVRGPDLQYLIAVAWVLNVVRDVPTYATEWDEQTEVYHWVECQNDLECRLREKFDEYRESGELSDLAKDHWNNPVNHGTKVHCKETSTDEDLEIWHYAECNPGEFFAVISEIFSNNSYRPPFDREGLKELDEDLYDLMVEAWAYDPESPETTVASPISTVAELFVANLTRMDLASFYQNENDQSGQRWLSVNVSLNRGHGGIDVKANGIDLKKSHFLSTEPYLQHLIAYAWNINVIRDVPKLAIEWNPELEVYNWDECQNDLDCRLRDKFEEYRDNEELSELVLEVWAAPVNFRDNLLCREDGNDPNRDIYHWGECNPDTFFATISEMFMNISTSPPYDRMGLKRLDADLYTLLIESWGYDPDVVAYREVAEFTHSCTRHGEPHTPEHEL